jgi:hypothetical protein
MTLKARFANQLTAIGPFASGEHVCEIDEGTQHLECQLTALDSLGCALTRLALRSPALAGQSIEGLKKTAEQLAAKLTYLLEPISPIEIDAAGCVVQLRSNPPQKEADRTSYYELLVSRAGEISLCRYSRVSKQGRDLIAAQLTREVLLRLAGDFSAAAG